MPELDGVWDVERTGGALPPLVGVRKRIHGARGETVLGPLPGVPFDVDGLSLRYGAPLGGLVDQLEPEADGFRGVATFRGREIGRFAMRRSDSASAGAEPGAAKTPLVQRIDEAYAMEQGVLRMLDSMLSTTDDPELRTLLERHRHETEGHGARLKERLNHYGASPSAMREAAGMLSGVVKGFATLGRPDDLLRTMREAFAAEHMEIAAYELLERIATLGGDDETAKLAVRNRFEEQAMADRIAADWDRIVELSLRDS